PARRADRGQPVQGVRPVHRAGSNRRPLLRPTRPRPPRTPGNRMTAHSGHSGDTPMTPRPAATVMLLRDTADGIAVFMLQRHSRMEFAPGTTVFPGGGVDDRDRNADIAWAGPAPAWWAQRLGVDEDLALALVCAAVRETFEECGVLLAGPDKRTVVTDV